MIELLRLWFHRYFSDPQIVILVFLLLIGFVLIFFLGNMLTPFFAALVIAYLLDGMVIRLQRLKLPRIASVVIVFLLFMIALFLVLIGLLPMMSRQIGQLVQELPGKIAHGQQLLMVLPEKYPKYITEAQIEQVFDFVASELTILVKRALSFSLASVKGIITIIIYLILVPLMVFFFLKDKEMIIEWFSRFLPDERKLATEVWNEVNVQTGNYIRGKIWEILIVWWVTYITFRLLGLQFGLLLSFFVGLSVLVPYIGATVMFFPVALIAFFQWGWGSEFAYVMIALGVIQALDGNLLVPLLLSGVVNLHPISIIVALLVFGGLWGLWGLFFAIPLATLVHAVIKAWTTQHKRKQKESKMISRVAETTQPDDAQPAIEPPRADTGK
jgi:putative permease